MRRCRAVAASNENTGDAALLKIALPQMLARRLAVHGEMVAQTIKGTEQALAESVRSSLHLAW